MSRIFSSRIIIIFVLGYFIFFLTTSTQASWLVTMPQDTNAPNAEYLLYEVNDYKLPDGTAPGMSVGGKTWFRFYNGRWQYAESDPFNVVWKDVSNSSNTTGERLNIIKGLVGKSKDTGLQYITQQKDKYAADRAKLLSGEKPTVGLPQTDVSKYSPIINVRLGSAKFTFDPVNCSGNLCTVPWLSQYIQAIYRYGISIAVILTIVMIMAGGFIWLMSAGSPDKVGKAKEFIISAFTGLLLALFSYLILFSINPRTTKLQEIAIQEIAAMAITPTKDIGQPGGPDSSSRPDTVGGGVRMSPYKTTGNNSSGNSVDVKKFSDGLGSNNPLKQINVNTAARTATFIDSRGQSVTVPINIGTDGVSAPGTGVEGDKKTPTGDFTLNSNQRISNNPNSPIGTSDGVYNFGPAFIDTGATDSKTGADRGIGFHGSQNDDNVLRPTFGCIRMDNDDLTYLDPYMSPGTVVHVYDTANNWNVKPGDK